jgi:hypothetical protein
LTWLPVPGPFEGGVLGGVIGVEVIGVDVIGVEVIGVEVIGVDVIGVEVTGVEVVPPVAGPVGVARPLPVPGPLGPAAPVAAEAAVPVPTGVLPVVVPGNTTTPGVPWSVCAGVCAALPPVAPTGPLPGPWVKRPETIVLSPLSGGSSVGSLGPGAVDSPSR